MLSINGVGVAPAILNQDMDHNAVCFLVVTQWKDQSITERLKKPAMKTDEQKQNYRHECDRNNTMRITRVRNASERENGL